ncbi:MAG: penicillin-binding protein 2 [Planctomycetota bacterium]
MVLAFAFLLVLLLALEGRLFFLQILRSPATVLLVTRYQLRDVKEPRARGRIVDRSGRALAESVPAYDIELWRPALGAASRPRDIIDRAHLMATTLGRFLPITAAQLLPSAGSRPYALLRADVTEPSVVLPIMQLAENGKLRGVDLRRDYARRYPHGELTGWTVGYVNHEQDGVFGIEGMYDQVLKPKAGERTLRHDGRNVEYFDPCLDADPGAAGSDVVLTIDLLLQDIVHSALGKTVAEHAPDQVVAIVTNPRTGDVLAVDQWPPLDPEQLNKVHGDGWSNRAFQDYYTPGSTFKPFIMALALDRHVVQLGETIDCENGRLSVPGRKPITDVHPLGVVPLAEVIVHSSNVGMVKVGQHLVPADEPKGGSHFRPVLQTLQALGFGSLSGLGFPCENPGRLTALKDWTRNYTLTSVSFGYEVGVTAVQMAAAYSVFCNGGWLQPLRIVKQIEHADGTITPCAPRARRRVYGAAAADAVRDMMVGVVEEGTGKQVEFPPIGIAGKSGTTTPPGRFDPEQGRAKVASFVAFAPAQDPTLLVLVVARKNAVKSTYYGATVAGPAVREILEKGLALDGVVVAPVARGSGEEAAHAGF